MNEIAAVRSVVKITGKKDVAEKPFRHADDTDLSSVPNPTFREKVKAFVTSKPIFVYILTGYLAVALFIAAPICNWTFARDNGFLKWFLFGEVVATAKAIVWPYFLFTSSGGVPRDFDHCMIKFSKNTIDKHSLTLIRRSCRAFSRRQDTDYDTCILKNMPGINNTSTAYAVSRKCKPPSGRHSGYTGRPAGTTVQPENLKGFNIDEWEPIESR